MELPVEPEPQRGYSMRFVVVKHAYKGAVRVYDDGQASIHRHCASPDRPLLIECEGGPTPDQLATLANVWRALSQHFTFTIATFDDVLLEHANTIMGRLELPPAA